MNADKIYAESIAKEYAPRDNSKLLALQEKKEFEYITVSEICEAVEVNRSTFYLHYENTADLLKATVRWLLDDFLFGYRGDPRAVPGE